MKPLSNNPVVSYFEGRTPEMVRAIQRLAEVESPSSNVPALDRCAEALSTYLRSMTELSPTVIRTGKEQRPHLRLDLGDRTDVLFIGHFDTVHPVGTLAAHPVRVDGHRIHGPGTLDMKGGIVVMTEVARYLQTIRGRPNVTLFFDSDEELGSSGSAPHMRDLATDARVALVFDYGDPTGALRCGSRGVRQFRVTVRGKGGHTAYPERTVNPVDALVDIIASARRYHHPEDGVVVVATVIEASDSVNVVPNEASVCFDVRARSDEQLEIVQKGIERLGHALTDATAKVELLCGVPTFRVSHENHAKVLAQESAQSLGWSALKMVESRGASDANQVAFVNPSVLDGFGGWGDGPHSPHREYIEIDSLGHCASLAAVMTESVLAGEADVDSVVTATG